MRYLVISDIHANLIALDAVLADAEGEYDKIWCLGDVVGYGPYPNECIERLQEYDHLCIAGNHDWAMVDKLDFEDFSLNAAFAVAWSKDRIKPENQEYLRNLPLYTLQERAFTLVHASPRHQIWEYITSAKIAHLNFDHIDTTYCLVGHTHSPVIFVETTSAQSICDEILPQAPDFSYRLNQRRLIINPGSVGQPRDGDPRASYGILDTDQMQFNIRRTPYKIATVQALMQKYEFPPKLWQRLELGY